MGLLADIRWFLRIIRGSRNEATVPTPTTTSPAVYKPAREGDRIHEDYFNRTSIGLGIATVLIGAVALIISIYIVVSPVTLDVKSELVPVYKLAGLWGAILTIISGIPGIVSGCQTKRSQILANLIVAVNTAIYCGIPQLIICATGIAVSEREKSSSMRLTVAFVMLVGTSIIQATLSTVTIVICHLAVTKIEIDTAGDVEETGDGEEENIERNESNVDHLDPYGTGERSRSRSPEPGHRRHDGEQSRDPSRSPRPHRSPRDGGERDERRRRDGERPRSPRPDGEGRDRSRSPRPDGERRDRSPRPGGENRDRSRSPRPDAHHRDRSRSPRPDGLREPPRTPRPEGERRDRSRSPRPDAEREENGREGRRSRRDRNREDRSRNRTEEERTDEEPEPPRRRSRYQYFRQNTFERLRRRFVFEFDRQESADFVPLSKREAAIKIMAICRLILGFFIMVLGAVVMVKDNDICTSFTTASSYMGAGLWCGVFTICTSTISIMAFGRTTKWLVYNYVVSSVQTLAFSAPYVIINIIGILETLGTYQCMTHFGRYMPVERGPLRFLYICSLVLSIVLLCLDISTSILSGMPFCCTKVEEEEEEVMPSAPPLTDGTEIHIETVPEVAVVGDYVLDLCPPSYEELFMNPAA